MALKKEEIKRKIALFVSISSILISSSVLVGWLVSYEPILRLLPGVATMKINTCFVFLFGGINILLLDKINKQAYTVYIALSAFIGFIGFLTLNEYIFNFNFSIDNLLVLDKFSTNLPGRMSPATALNAILLSLGFIGYRLEETFFEKLGLIASKTALVISFTSIVSYLLSIPLENRTFFFETMAIHTSFLYLLQLAIIILKYESSSISKLLFSNLNGSKIFRKLLPFLIILPLVFCYFMIIAINENAINADFGIAIYIVISVPLTLIVLTKVTLNLNKVNEEQVLLSKSLELSNNHLSLFKNALDKIAVITIIDNNGLIKYVNEKAVLISGYSREEMIGKKNTLLNSNYHEPSFFSTLWNTINKGEIWEGNLKYRNKYNTFFWLDCAIIPFKNKNDFFSEFLLIMYDITERKKTQELRKEYIKKIEAKNEELEQYTYIASHDLQEPLNTILGYVSRFNKRYENRFDEKDKKMLGYILDASLRMRSLIKNILDYGRIGQKSKIERIDCNEIVENTKKDYHSIIREKNAKIFYEDLPSILGVKSQIQLLFQNLISNALKFSRNNVNTEISISFTENDQFWTFKVRDNGIGIEKEHQSRIFKIFQRLHNRSNYKGNGIGLSHCKKIVELHDGEIWVESSINKGSSFYFTISKHLSKNYEKKAK